MAMFREHIAVGAIVSMIAVVIVYYYALITSPPLLATLFFITVVGSFLPDVDSDSGIPFYLVFGTATLIATGLVLLFVFTYPPGNVYLMYGAPIIALLFIWFVIGGIVKKCTHHRGMFHSFPAMCIAGFATLIVAAHSGLSDVPAFVFGVAMAAGFLSHLILDELYSGITLDGLPFVASSTTGSALKLFSSSKGANLTTYLCLGALVYMAFNNVALAATLEKVIRTVS